MKILYTIASTYTLLTIGFFIALGSVCISMANNVEDLTVSISPTVLQIIPDWQQIPYVDVQVSAGNCAEGWEPIFNR